MMNITYGMCCDNQFCQCNFDGKCTVFTCTFTGGYYVSNRTKTNMNTQDNETTSADSQYIICPHCGKKIYR